MVDVTIQYRDGGKDFFGNVVGSSIQDRVFVIEESNHTKVFIVLGVITFIRVEDVSNEEDSVPF